MNEQPIPEGSTVEITQSLENNGLYEIVYPTSDEVMAAAAKAVGDISDRERKQALGKMFNCKVCTLRHRDTQKCEQRFKELWIDEDLETGEFTTVYATVPLHNQRPTIKAIMGAQQFKGKRRQRRPNAYQLQVVELTRKIFPTLDATAYENEQAQMIAARDIAITVFRKDLSRKSKRKRKQQDVSRRVNRGLLRNGSTLESSQVAWVSRQRAYRAIAQ